MVLGTDTGELLIIEGTELKATLQLDPGSTVHSIAAYAKVSLLCVFSWCGCGSVGVAVDQGLHVLPMLQCWRGVHVEGACLGLFEAFFLTAVAPAIVLYLQLPALPTPTILLPPTQQGRTASPLLYNLRISGGGVVQVLQQELLAMQQHLPWLSIHCLHP